MAAWFKPKRYGYGATPTTWRGWALTVGFAALIFALVWGLIGFDRSREPEGATLALFLVCVAILVAALWIISKRTSDGEWRWRWGQASK
jgi:membrane protein YdbS with pleckstrin-like domain